LKKRGLSKPKSLEIKHFRKLLFMKTIKLLILGIFAFSAMSTFTSCMPDPCETVVCQNGGTCVEGTCECPDGYEGTNCETATVDKFVGTYTAVEVCNGITLPSETASISKSSTDVTKIEIFNFNALNTF